MEFNKYNEDLNIQQNFNNKTKALDEIIKNQRQPSEKKGIVY